MLANKNIILGVCGSIASYKAASLVRLLVKAGANVRVIMTREATGFITPLTLSTLSKNPVLTEYSDSDTGSWNNHVELGLWADLLIIAPVTANTLAKLANGICDNLLTAVYLSARCPVFFAPAMDLDMWEHPATRKNIDALLSYGNHLIQPTHGELASGLVGEGRLAEPEDILEQLEAVSKKKVLTGKKALVTAGPTYEAIDPVRFIGNHSSGKMGFAIAEELSRLGADVTLVSGPTTINITDNSIKRIDVVSAEQMYQAVMDQFAVSDITVMSAAVADYRPATVSETKIKKNNATLDIPLIKTTDVLASIGKLKREDQILVGFALETNNEVENAVSKLKRKNLDFIVLNSLRDEGAGFKFDGNKITIIDKQQHEQAFPLKPKKEVAKDICEKIIDLIG